MPKEKILIVEDERVVAMDIQNRLKDLGYSVCGSASSGEDAVKKASKLQPDLVLMDIVLKGKMDGIDAAGQIRERFNIPVVYLTAFSDEKTLQRARLTGPYGYILKPFEDSELRSNVEMALYKGGMDARIKHLNLVLSAIRSVNQLIVREKDPDRLIQDTCANLIETRGFLSAWIALLDENGEITTTAESGLGEVFLPMIERLKRGELTECAKRALAKPDVVVIKDPSATCLDCPLAGNYDGKAGTSIRIEHGGRVYGLLTVSMPIDFMTEEELSLFKEIAGDISFALHAIEIEKERKLAEEGLRERTYELGERVKELDCLYNIARLIEKQDTSLDEFLQSAVNIIPSAFQYPDIACARIILEGKEFRTKNFREAPWKQTCNIKSYGESIGTLEVSYIEQRPEKDEGLFIKEEINLLTIIAERLAHITERKQAEEEIRSAKSFIDRVVDMSPFAMWISDRKGTVIRTNSSLREALNMPDDKIVGQYNVLKDENLEKQGVMPMVMAVFENHEPANFSIPWKAAMAGDVNFEGARDLYIDVSIFPIVSAEGELTNAVCQWVDITEQKKAEESLRESREKFKSIVDNTGIGVALISPAMEILEMNHQMREWFPEHDLDKRPICYRTFNNPPREEICEYCPTCKTLEDGKVHEDTTVTPQAGKTRNYRIVSSPLINSQGEVTAAIEMVEDITERLNLQAQLIQSQKMEAIGTLAGGIAHDFNNILGSILGYTELSMMGVPEGSKLKKNLTEVFQAGNRAKTLIQQILAFSRKQELEQKPLQLKYIVKESLKLLRSTLPTDIEIKEDIAKDVGVVNADPTQMQQVIMNLCTNAGHAMQKDGGVLAVGLANVELDDTAAAKYLNMSPGHYLRFSVSDTGYGMTPDVKERIFEPFFTTKAPSEGTGLGLSVVHGIVKSHGGTITVYSEPGKGSTFHMYLPLIQEEAIKPEMDEQAPIPTGNERILFIDDEQALADLGKQMLERLGYKVTTRTSSIEALELFKAQPDQFDLVITDMTMPKMTGDKLAQELMKIRPDIPIIICTGHSRRISEEKTKGMGIKALVMKPLMMRDIANTVRKVLEGEKEKPAEGLILVIDDDDQFRGMLRETLEGAGYDVMDAPNGKEGIRVFRENPADLVITDIIMPEKEGIETIKELKRDFPEVKIIAMSGGARNGPAGYLKMAKMLGAQCTLTKPLERDEFLNTIRELLTVS